MVLGTLNTLVATQFRRTTRESLEFDTSWVKTPGQEETVTISRNNCTQSNSDMKPSPSKYINGLPDQPSSFTRTSGPRSSVSLLEQHRAKLSGLKKGHIEKRKSGSSSSQLDGAIENAGRELSSRFSKPKH